MALGPSPRTVFQQGSGACLPVAALCGVRASGHWAQQEVNKRSTGQHAWCLVILAAGRESSFFLNSFFSPSLLVMSQPHPPRGAQDGSDVQTGATHVDLQGSAPPAPVSISLADPPPGLGRQNSVTIPKRVDVWCELRKRKCGCFARLEAVGRSPSYQLARPDPTYLPGTCPPAVPRAGMAFPRPVDLAVTALLAGWFLLSKPVNIEQTTSTALHASDRLDSRTWVLRLRVLG